MEVIMAGSPFLESVRADIRLRGYSIRTEKSYLFWIKQFILFNGKVHPDQMGAKEVKAWLSWLANYRHVAVNTQKVCVECSCVSLSQSTEKRAGGIGLYSGAQPAPIAISSYPTGSCHPSSCFG